MAKRASKRESTDHFGGLPSNMAVKPSVRPVTGRACARPAPARPAAHGQRWRGRCAPRQRGRVFPSAGCPGASRRANQRLQRMAGPASTLACPSPAEPRLR